MSKIGVDYARQIKTGEHMKRPIDNMAKEYKDPNSNREDIQSIRFECLEAQPLGTWNYYIGTEDEVSWKDRNDDSVPKTHIAEAQLTYTTDEEFTSNEDFDAEWKDKCSMCGEPTLVGIDCKKCNYHNKDWIRSDEKTENEGCPTRRKPYWVHINGCDDSSYSKVFATLEEAMIEFQLLMRTPKISMYDFIDELGYAFTN